MQAAREVFVLCYPDGTPAQASIHEHRVQPSKPQRDAGWYVERYAPATKEGQK